MTYAEDYATLHIRDLDLEDAGKYRCKATNEHGDTSTTAKLAVEGMF